MDTLVFISFNEPRFWYLARLEMLLMSTVVRDH